MKISVLSKAKRYATISIALIVCLLVSIIPTFAVTGNTESQVTANESVIARLAKTNDFTVKDKSQINRDLSVMKDLALPVNQIKDISRRKSKLIYSMKMTNDVTDDIVVSKAVNGDVELAITEGDLKNKLKICSNGDLFLDGEKIVIQEESSYSDNDSITNFRSKQAGWTSTPPSNIKSWKFRKETKKSHIYLNTKAGQISISALGIILFNAGWLGYVVSCASFIHTVGSDSKCLSLKRKTYDGIPKGYLAVKVVESAFTKANYKGKKKTVVQYGYNVPNV